jgi:RNA polymerase sigma factor (sigma-70 family)
MDPADVPDTAEPSAAQRHAERDRLVRALATLSVRQRRVVVLRHLEALSEREVAEALGVSVGTVKSTASRGLARVRDLLGDEHTADRDPGTHGTPPATTTRSQ